MERVETVVIGAGVIGLAIARALATSAREVVVAEAESAIGTGVSSRNSGVIHAGIYYPPGSAKARFCVEGKALLYAYAKARDIPHRRCEKLIVATSEAEEATLALIAEKARRNGVDDLVAFTAADAMALEPELYCTRALLSPSTGIVDVHALLYALLADMEAAGGVLALSNPVLGGEVTPEGIRLRFETGDILARQVINAAGLGAQQVAASIAGLAPAHIPPLYLAKGNYFALFGPAPFTRLIYPVPVQGGLGAHYTMNMEGGMLFGPDVEWLESPDPHNYDVDPERALAVAASVQRYWPSMVTRQLSPAYAGIRPKISARGAVDSDFMIQGPESHGIPGLFNLYGIESPGITAALAVAQYVTARC